MTDLASPPDLDVDPYATDVLENPYPFFARLRDAGPVVRIPRYDVYAVGGYGEVETVLKDYSRFTAESGVGLQDFRVATSGARPNSPLGTDPPRHTNVRSALNKIMSPAVIRQWRESLAELADEFVAALVVRGRFDGVTDVAEPFIMQAFQRVTGVRLDPVASRAIGDMSFNMTGPPNELYHAGIAAGQPYLKWFEDSCKRSSVEPGSLADRIFDAEDAGNLPPGTATGIVGAFVRGGTDTTISGLGFLLNQVAQDPAQWEILKANPAKLKVALDEAIRFESPFHVVYRMTIEDTELSGVALKGGTKIGAFLGASNRDARKWNAPDRFDLNRMVAGVHLSFGTGAHNCVGQMIARMEVEALLTSLTRLAPSIEPDGAPSYRLLNQVRTLEALPLKIGS